MPYALDDQLLNVQRTLTSRNCKTAAEVAGVRVYGSVCPLKIQVPAFEFPFFGCSLEAEVGCKTLEDMFQVLIQ